ncbi:MAG TPA: hypothetical protein VI413_13885 [Paludibacter sp.]
MKRRDRLRTVFTEKIIELIHDKLPALLQHKDISMNVEIFKKQLRKYFFLMTGFYIGIRLIVFIVLMVFPDLLTIHFPDHSFRTVSSNYLIVALEYLTNLIFIYLINKDMKQTGQRSVPVLIVTFFYSTAGVLFYLILLFASNYKSTNIKYGTNS